MIVLAALLAAAAVAVALAPATGSDRLRAALGLDLAPGLPSAQAVVAPPTSGARGGPAAACLLAGLAVLAVVGGPTGAALGGLVALAGPIALARLEPAAVRRDREELARDLPLALDLLAACLAGGASMPGAVRATARAVEGSCGARLMLVAARLEVGSAPADAWAALCGDPSRRSGGRLAGGQPAALDRHSRVGGSAGSDLAGSAARALARAGEGGAPVATAVARLAEDARRSARARGEQAAQRAGVLAVAPLGLCFLPAFVLIGIVPVIAGLVGPLLAGF